MRFLSKTNIDFISKQKITGFLSIALIVAGIASLIMKGGPLLSIDFTGGTVAQIKFNHSSLKTVEHCSNPNFLNEESCINAGHEWIIEEDIKYTRLDSLYEYSSDDIFDED